TDVATTSGSITQPAQVGAMHIGRGSPASWVTDTPIMGTIDHLMVWEGSAPSRSEIDDLRVAGRHGWAGQRLDERLRSVAASLGVDGLVGELEASRIVTNQSYRP